MNQVLDAFDATARQVVVLAPLLPDAVERGEVTCMHLLAAVAAVEPGLVDLAFAQAGPWRLLLAGPGWVRDSSSGTPVSVAFTDAIRRAHALATTGRRRRRSPAVVTIDHLLQAALDTPEVATALLWHGIPAAAAARRARTLTGPEAGEAALRERQDRREMLAGELDGSTPQALDTARSRLRDLATRYPHDAMVRLRLALALADPPEPTQALNVLEAMAADDDEFLRRTGHGWVVVIHGSTLLITGTPATGAVRERLRVAQAMVAVGPQFDLHPATVDAVIALLEDRPGDAVERLAPLQAPDLDDVLALALHRAGRPDEARAFAQTLVSKTGQPRFHATWNRWVIRQVMSA